MELRWLESFVAVAEELHFGRAATRLHMAQSPLSQTIRKLEAELGVALFDRSTRSVALTPAGRALLPHAHRVFREIELGRQATGEVAGRLYGTVRIGFSGAFNHRTLTPLTRAVRQRYPAISLELNSRVLTRDGIEQLEQGALDIAFVGLPVPPSTLRTRLITREAIGVVLPDDHRFARDAAVDLAALADDDFVATPSSAGSAMQEVGERACVTLGFRPRVVQEISDPYMLLTLVAAGVGVALVPSAVEELTPPGAVFRPLLGEHPTMDHALAWRGDDPSTVLRAVLDIAEAMHPAD